MNLDNQLIIIRNIDDVQDIDINNEDYIVIGVIGPEGPQGPRGPQGIQGPQGIAGEDGFSPTANVTQSDGVTTISITDKEGTTTASIDMSDYYTKDEVDESQDNQDLEINSLKNIIDQMPKVTGSGTSITLNNTIEAPMKLELKPSELEQITTTGKNLWKTIATTTKNGVTFTNNGDGSYTLNGTATANSSFYVSVNYPTGTYTLSINNSQTMPGGADYLLLETSGGTSTNKTLVLSVQNNSSTFELTSTIRALVVVISSGKVYNNFVIKPMLETGSSASPFEPYTGGIASPNPSYPQQIHTISGDNEIVVQNKNLFDKNIEQGTINGTTGEPSTSTNRIRTNDFINVNPNTEYTLSINESDFRTYIFQYNKNNVFVSRIPSSWGTLPCTFTTSNGVEKIKVIFSKNNDTDITPSSISKVQLEKGSTPTSYIEHKEQVKEINLGSLEYCEIGDYKDEFYLATDSDTGLVSGKWYIKKNIGKVVLDGSEDWSTIGVDRYYITVNNKRSLTSVTTCLLKSNYFNATANAGDTTNVGQMTEGYYTTGNQTIRFNYNGSNSDLAGFKTWLSTHNTIVYYILATPSYTLLNNTLQTQLEDIYNTMKSYNGQTNISQVNNDLGFTINASALLDLNTLIGGN